MDNKDLTGHTTQRMRLPMQAPSVTRDQFGGCGLGDEGVDASGWFDKVKHIASVALPIAMKLAGI